jgi:hypothetical protein
LKSEVLAQETKLFLDKKKYLLKKESEASLEYSKIPALSSLTASGTTDVSDSSTSLVIYNAEQNSQQHRQQFNNLSLQQQQPRYYQDSQQPQFQSFQNAGQQQQFQAPLYQQQMQSQTMLPPPLAMLPPFSQQQPQIGMQPIFSPQQQYPPCTQYQQFYPPANSQQYYQQQAVIVPPQQSPQYGSSAYPVVPQPSPVYYQPTQNNQYINTPIPLNFHGNNNRNPANNNSFAAAPDVFPGMFR